MTPNDLDQYLAVFTRYHAGSIALKLPNGAEIHAVFMPELPAVGKVPEPGGWKTMPHLDDPHALRDVQEYKGDLPS